VPTLAAAPVERVKVATRAVTSVPKATSTSMVWLTASIVAAPVCSGKEKAVMSVSVFGGALLPRTGR